jgi:V8-like Glu-specific endopeptidase
MQATLRWRFGALLTAAVMSALVVSMSATPAEAKSAPPADSAAVEASGNASGTAAVSTEAWAAGRAKFGSRATAAQAVASFWTPERMRAATPLEDSAAYRDAIRAYDQQVTAERQRARTAPERPKPAPQVSHSIAPRAGTVGGTQAATPGRTGATVPAAVDPGQPYWAPTARTNGKVYFQMNGGSWQCSASIINSEGQNTVWTAGHCVNAGNGGSWATNWQFVPSYDANRWWNPAPYGTWTASQLWSRTAWISSGDFSQDMGVAIMGMNFGYHIVGYLGGQGFITNVGTNVWENTFGYPAESPFTGGHLYECYGWTSPEWSFLFWWSHTLQVPCDMTRGESGGPWLYNWDGNWGYLNGVNSRIDQIVNPTVTYSPYFDDNAWSLYNATRYL